MKRFLYPLIALLLTCGVISYAQVPGINSTINPVFTMAYDNGSNKPAYTVSELITPATTSRQILQINGSATKLVRVRRVILEGTSVTGVTEPVYFNKVSSALPAATVVGSLLTTVPFDSTWSAATATPEAFNIQAQADPTLVGELQITQLSYNLVPTGSKNLRDYLFGQLGSAINLRGTSEGLSINLAGVAPVGVVSLTVEWTEE